MRASISAFACLLSIACGDDHPSPTHEPVPSIPRTENYVQVVPFENTPAGVVTQDANNNLDIVDHEGRIYFAFRTAPTHFASEHVELYVVSSTDQQSWELEHKIDLDRDIREPRFLSLGGRLWMYYAVLGTSSIDFEPQGTFRIERNADGTWSEPEEVFELGFIPWRIKVYGDTAYMLGYVGGENIYDFMEGSVDTYWLKTTDGTSWEAADDGGGDGIVLVGGSSEADFVFLDDGSIVAVARNELGDASGWGSKICTAPASDLGTWSCSRESREQDLAHQSTAVQRLQRQEIERIEEERRGGDREEEAGLPAREEGEDDPEHHARQRPHEEHNAALPPRSCGASFRITPSSPWIYRARARERAFLVTGATAHRVCRPMVLESRAFSTNSRT